MANQASAGIHAAAWRFVYSLRTHEELVRNDFEAAAGLAIPGAGLLYAPTFIVQKA